MVEIYITISGQNCKTPKKEPSPYATENLAKKRKNCYSAQAKNSSDKGPSYSGSTEVSKTFSAGSIPAGPAMKYTKKQKLT